LRGEDPHNFASFSIAAVVTISQFEASVSEGAEMAEVCVSIDRPIISDVMFTLTPDDETASGTQIRNYVALGAMYIMQSVNYLAYLEQGDYAAHIAYYFFNPVLT
jgi:hypothetical protein